MMAEPAKIDRCFIVTLAEGGYHRMGSPKRTDDIALASLFTESQANFVASNLAGAKVSRDAV